MPRVKKAELIEGVVFAASDFLIVVRRLHKSPDVGRFLATRLSFKQFLAAA
jgi:hypothetical protein